MNYGDTFTIKDYGKYFLWAECYGANIIEIEDGLYQLVKNPDAKEPIAEDIEETRANMYQLFVDPITCHIQRLKDESSITNELNAEITSLIEKRKAKVAEIKELFPYPVEPEPEPVEPEVPLSTEPDIDAILAK